ncbi:MAG: O-antigen ligase family protein [Chloroflexota bacterium]
MTSSRALQAWRAAPLQALRRAAWALFFLTLPVTSFPFLPDELGGRTLVRPLSIYPLLALLLLAVLPALWRRRLPRTLLPLLAFVVSATLSSLLAFTSGLDAYRGVDLTARFARNMLTLGLGISFYLAVALLPQSWDDLRFSLRWLYAGFGVALLWGTLQIPYVVHFNATYFRLAGQLQGLVSSRKLFTTRISGMTYEPKWFAEQIVFLLMPWLLASLLTGRSLFQRRWRGITVEMALLAWAVPVMLFTYSRTGMLVAAVLAFVSFVLYQARAHRRAGRAAARATHPVAPPRLRLARRLVEAGLILVGIAAVIFIAGSQNAYFSRLWNYWGSGSKARSRTYLEYISFEQRFVYWATALRIYDEQPLFGVGLGNYAFYFVDNLPNQPYDQQQEIMRQITPGEGRDRLITPKNLYARLVAETGLVGTALFSAFLLANLGCVLYLWFSPGQEARAWAVGGGLSLLVLCFVIFSFDSFALPNMWVALGLITAAAHQPDPKAMGGEP